MASLNPRDLPSASKEPAVSVHDGDSASYNGSKPPMGSLLSKVRIALLLCAGCDLVAITVFFIVGMTSHGQTITISHLLERVIPFYSGLLLILLISVSVPRFFVDSRHQDRGSVCKVAILWRTYAIWLPVIVVIGFIGRGTGLFTGKAESTPFMFVITGTIFLSIFMALWRGLAMLWLRLRK